jgi:hypothetical protein
MTRSQRRREFLAQAAAVGAVAPLPLAQPAAAQAGAPRQSALRTSGHRSQARLYCRPFRESHRTGASAGLSHSLRRLELPARSAPRFEGSLDDGLLCRESAIQGFIHGLLAPRLLLGADHGDALPTFHHAAQLRFPTLAVDSHIGARLLGLRCGGVRLGRSAADHTRQARRDSEKTQHGRTFNGSPTQRHVMESPPHRGAQRAASLCIPQQPHKADGLGAPPSGNGSIRWISMSIGTLGRTPTFD